MKIQQGYPPNYDQIRSFLTPPEQAVFPYGDIIYNPSGQDIPEDIIYHEYIHAKQQDKMGVGFWWDKYLSDPYFRLDQEIQAYGEQLMWLKKHGLSSAGREYALAEFAEMLEMYYNVGKTRHELKTLIRKYATK